METQDFEYLTPLRIKFASVAKTQLAPPNASVWLRPQVFPDATDIYPGLFDELPAEWSIESLEMIETISEYTRPAIRLTNGTTTVVAVEHETGLELLLDPDLLKAGAELAGSLSAIAALVSRMWERWSERRAATSAQRPSNDSIFYERTITAPDGTITQHRVYRPATAGLGDVEAAIAAAAGTRKR